MGKRGSLTMAKNFLQPGDVITLTAPRNVKSGEIVSVGAFIGVAAFDAAEGAPIEVALTGAFELPKGSGALAPGDLAYWVDGRVTGSAGENGAPLLGAVTEAAGANATVARVRLNGITT
jgi:predicted RecA/RadA family phage recombinase